MKFCTKCGKEIFDEAVICPHCGCSTESNNTSKKVNSEDDQVSVGLCILAALIPLFGIIYWPVKHKEAPRRARACGVTAIVSWAVSFVLMMFMMSL